MKRDRTKWVGLSGVLLFGVLSGCASVSIPRDLSVARQTYNQAAGGPAARLAPAELEEAHAALLQAEDTFRKNDDNQRTSDLAYIATRKAEIADAAARRIMAERQAALAMNELDQLKKHAQQATQEELEKMKRELASREQELRSKEERDKLEAQIAEKEKELARSRQELAMQERQLESARKERAEALSREQAAIESLKQVAQVKEEARGMVITLSGSVIFPTAQHKLLPIAKQRLDQVAEVLKENTDQSIVVEGYTDSVGRADYNEALSQQRAEAVRDYLIEQGVDRDRIKAVGKGEASPVASNRTPEGRAMNRRVEIVLSKERSKID